MKKLPALFFCAIAIIITGFSCMYTNDNKDIDISISENDHAYSMEADFSKSRTRDVEEYMDKKIGKSSNMSFVNTRIDGQLALDDHTTFYIKKYPGFVKIKLNKDENSGDSYREIKTMCEGIKKLLAK